MGGSSSLPEQANPIYKIYLNLIVDSEGEAPPIQAINRNQNSNQNNINLLIKREGNESKIIYSSENQNVNLKINGKRIIIILIHLKHLQNKIKIIILSMKIKNLF